MSAKIISQKKFAKLVASTGALSQPPGALSRMSNLLMTQRGSLQIASGSASIGQLPSPFLSASALAAFTKYASGSYPLYPTLATPPGGNILASPQNFSITIDASGSNPAGTYIIAIVAQATISGVAVQSAATVIAFVATHSFQTMFFQWSPGLSGTLYEIYYLTSIGATLGLVIGAPTNGSLVGGFLTDSYNGSFSPGSQPVSRTNTSGLIQLLIGNVSPPSPVVNFTPIATPPLPAAAPQPAQLAPGDPNFQFDTVNTSQQTLFPTAAGGSASAVATSGSPSNSQTILVASGWSPSPTAVGQQITVSIPVTGGNSISPGTSGGGSIAYQYSLDSGATWATLSSFPATDTAWNLTLTFSPSPSALTDLSHLQIQIVATAQWGYGSGSISVSGSATGGAGIYISTSTSTSFSPYGGIPGQVGVLPQLVQFAGLEILILGNGYAPQSTDPTLLSAATLTALTNTFQAAYPTWQSGVDWLTGSQVTDGSNYYTATQGGVSGSTAPSWNTVLGTETSDGSVIWTSQGPIVASTAPRGAAHAVAYAGSLWLANTSPSTTSDGIDGPTCLKMSDSNNPNSWNPVNTAFIGRDDGTQITGLQSFTIAALGISPTGSLCVFKEFQTYQVIGVFGSASFEIQPAQTNLGCLASRSIQFLPGFGVVRWTHLGFAVFDGINDRLISEDIRPYLFGGVDSEADLVPVDPLYAYLSQSTQTASPPMYLCAMPLVGSAGKLTRLFCYDLVMKAWAVLDLPWAISSMNAVSTGEGYPLVLACKPADGTIQRFQSGDISWDQGATDQSFVAWSFRTPDVFGEGGSQRIFYESATIRGYGNPAMVQSILARLWLDGTMLGDVQGIDIVPQGGSNLFEAKVTIFRSGYRAHLDISGDNGGASGVIDAVDWAVVPKSTQARRIIS
jgi:hypothetical protein